jgi:hypothetical protein
VRQVHFRQQFSSSFRPPFYLPPRRVWRSLLCSHPFFASVQESLISIAWPVNYVECAGAGGSIPGAAASIGQPFFFVPQYARHLKHFSATSSRVVRLFSIHRRAGGKSWRWRLGISPQLSGGKWAPGGWVEGWRSGFDCN